MIGRLRLGLVLRDHRLAAVAVAGGRVRQAFTLEDPDNPAALLKAELDARRLRVRRAALGLPRSLATVKVLELPPAPGGDLARMVAFELERHVPFPAEDAAFDFLPLSAPGRQAASRPVLVVAAERRTVERALRLLPEARLAPASLGVACHDLPALLGPRPRAKRAVWIHVVGADAELLFLDGARLRLSRSVAAEGDLAAEVAQSLLHLGWESADALWASGDRADAVVADPELGRLGIPLAPPPLASRARRAVASLDPAADGLTLLALAVALRPSHPPLNLLPGSLRPRRLSRAQLVTAANVAAVALLGAALLVTQGLRSQRHLARLDAAIRALDPEVRAVERIAAELEGKRRLLTTLREVEASALRPLPLLRELTELIPADAWVTILSADPKGFEIAGQATAANQLIPLLEGSPNLKAVEFASPVTKGRDKEQFRIKAAWETPPAAAAPAPARAPARPGGAGR